MAPLTTDVFKAFSDPSRRQILQLLSKKSQTINSLAKNFDMSRPAISKHIKILHLSGFISIEDIGRERHCTLKRKGFIEMQSWMDFFDTFWKQKLNSLETLLNNKTTTK
jgi:DNA-binding transcriptional ArsR family regulator